MFYYFIINITILLTSKILFISKFFNIFRKFQIKSLQNNFIFNKQKELHNNFLNKMNFIELKEDLLVLHSHDKSNYYINRFYNNTIFRKVRVSEYYSKDIEMLNIVWYPQYNYDIPILNIDLIKYKENMSICFINLFEIQSKFNQLFKTIKFKYPDFFDNKTLLLLPFKYLLSESMIFSYIYDYDKFNKIESIMEEYINNYINIEPKIINEELSKNKHAEYNFIRNKIDKKFILNKDTIFNKKNLNDIINIINIIYKINM
jgi:hypothetical protein